MLGRRLVLLTLVFGLAPTSWAAAQTERPARTPAQPKGDPDARLTRRTSGDAIAIALEQVDCPLTLSPVGLAHDERGSTLKLRVLNEGAADVTRYRVSAWVVQPDGTLKGAQTFDQKQAIAAGAERDVTIIIRTMRVATTDAVVVAVVETQGDAWKGDAKALETEARAAVKK